MKEIHLDYVNMHYEEPIIHLVFKDGIELGFPEIQELISYSEKLSGNKPYFVLSDVRENVNVTPEGRKISANAEASPLHRGTAVLVNTDMFKLAVNFFFGLKKPKFPYKAFTDKQTAIDWLLQLAAHPPKESFGPSKLPDSSLPENQPDNLT